MQKPQRGRPKEKAASYFTHDSSASADLKIIYLESKFGLTGYALYFKMIEHLCSCPDFETDWSDFHASILARKFGVESALFKEFITSATSEEVSAFVIENGKIFSYGLKTRLSSLVAKRELESQRISQKRAKTPDSPPPQNGKKRIVVATNTIVGATNTIVGELLENKSPTNEKSRQKQGKNLENEPEITAQNAFENPSNSAAFELLEQQIQLLPQQSHREEKRREEKRKEEDIEILTSGITLSSQEREISACDEKKISLSPFEKFEEGLEGETAKGYDSFSDVLREIDKQGAPGGGFKTPKIIKMPIAASQVERKGGAECDDTTQKKSSLKTQENGQIQNSELHAFQDSPYADLQTLENSFLGTDYEAVNAAYYQALVRNWAAKKEAQGNLVKSKNWRENIIGFILTHIAENKLVTNTKQYEKSARKDTSRRVDFDPRIAESVLDRIFGEDDTPRKSAGA